MMEMNCNGATGLRAAVIARRHFFKKLGIGTETREGDISAAGNG
jgi:hypothetical protein